MEKQAIDFVVTWVDGSDSDWRKRKAEVTGTAFSDDREERYRDWDLLRYWFRGVEQFAPWVRKVFFVCDQEPPVWLNGDCEKLQVVRHEDYIPSEYLPTFSSHPIELNLHRIPGLSEQFVYFNDDMHLIAPVSETDFFRKGLPCDAALLNPIPNTDLNLRKNGKIFTIPLNNTEYLNRDYNFRACVKAHPGKWMTLRYGKNAFRNWMLLTWPRFVGFFEPHMPQAYLKSSFEEAWKQDGDILDETSRRPLRDDRDVSPWLIRERQLAEGKFIPRSPKIGRDYDLDRNSEEAACAISGQKAKMLCLNDGPMSAEDFLRTKEIVQNAFQKILSNPSGFEKDLKA